MNETPLNYISLERSRIEALADTFDKHSKDLVVGFYHADLVSVLLDMPYQRITFGVVVEIDVVIERLLFLRIAHAKAGDEHVAAETVYLVLNRALKSLHDQKRNQRRGKADGDADECDPVYDRGEALFGTGTDSFGYKVG